MLDEKLYIQNLLDGKSYRDISEQRGLTIYQVRKSIDHLKNKFGCTSKFDLLLKFVNH